MNDNRTMVIYSRKSKFTGKGESIENQIEMCRQYIRLHFGEESADHALVYEDEGYSGGTLDRPQFKKMMEDSKQQAFRAIVVYRLDRISRNIADFAKLVDELNHERIDFISIREQFDTSSPAGRAMMFMSSVFSQMERETIAERIRDNMHELAKTGRWLGGNTPTGYASESMSTVTVDCKTKKAYKLKVVPEEIKIVQLIYKVFLETNSLTKTETYLLQNSFVTKNNRQFTRFSIRAILTNPVYMKADETAYQYLLDNHVELFSGKKEFDGVHGIMTYNRTLQQPGKTNQIRPMDEWIVAVGKHEGIIDGETWVRVQSMLNQNRSKSYRKPRSNTALLSGLLRCGNCGDYMRPKMTKRLNSDGEYVYSYLCNLKERSRSHLCNMKNCNGNLIDSLVIEEIKKLNENDSEFIRLLKQSKHELQGDRCSYDEELSRLKEQILENDEDIRKLTQSLARAAGMAAEDYIMNQINEYHDNGQILRQRLEDLRQLTAEHVLSDIEFDLLANILSQFKTTVDLMTVEQKRAAIRTFVKEIIWDGKQVHVVLFGSDYKYELPHDVPLGKNSK